MSAPFVTRSAEQTTALGRRIAALLFPGAFLALSGDLGAGKTALAKGIGEGLGIFDITSPTFTIVQEYMGRLPLYHFDAYRLHDATELYATGYEEYLYAGGVILMEWPALVAGALPPERLDVTISGSGEQPREIGFAAAGPKHLKLLQALLSDAEEPLC